MYIDRVRGSVAAGGCTCTPASFGRKGKNLPMILPIFMVLKCRAPPDFPFASTLKDTYLLTYLH